MKKSKMFVLSIFFLLLTGFSLFLPYPYSDSINPNSGPSNFYELFVMIIYGKAHIFLSASIIALSISIVLQKIKRPK